MMISMMLMIMSSTLDLIEMICNKVLMDKQRSLSNRKMVIMSKEESMKMVKYF